MSNKMKDIYIYVLKFNDCIEITGNGQAIRTYDKRGTMLREDINRLGLDKMKDIYIYVLKFNDCIEITGNGQAIRTYDKRGTMLREDINRLGLDYGHIK